MKRVLFNSLPVLILLWFTVSSAATTGKIRGRVFDAQTGGPLPGANVFIENTTLGAAADADGQYIILNVPPGTYTVTARMMGYVHRRVENVRVKIDLTTEIDYPMQETVLEAGETVTITAERPLVQKDMTGSMASVSSDDIEKLPVQEMSDVLRLQAGIVDAGGFHIRGGRSGEVAYWVDGIAATDVFSGGMGVQVENSAIKELQVISGTFNAEYGQAMSGIVNIVTKEGTPKLRGSIEGFVGDYYSTDNAYRVVDEVEVYQQSNGVTRTRAGEVNPLAEFNPVYNLQGTLSGPLPFFKKKAGFFVNSRYISDNGYLYGSRWFKPHGVPGDSSLVAMNPFQRWSTNAKLTFRPLNGLKLSYTLFYSDATRERSYSNGYKYNPDGTPLSNTRGFTQLLSVNHVLSPSTFYELKVSRLDRDIESYVYENPLAKPDYLIKVFADEETGRREYTFDPGTEDGQRQLQQIKEQRLVYFDEWRYVTDPDGPEGYIDPDYSGALPPYSYNRDGMSHNHMDRSTSYWIGKFDLTSQVNSTHQMKTGLEFRLHELDYHSFTIRPKVVGGEEVVPYEPAIPSLTGVYNFKYNRTPREFSAYIQDKIELQSLILNVGLRYDYFDANHVVPADPSDPNIYDPIKDEHIYKNWVAPLEKLSPKELDAYKAGFEKYTPDERRRFMHTAVDPKWQLSPRIGLAYPITEKGVIHLSYGHFFQMPEFRYLYARPDFKLMNSGTQTVFGNADLEAQGTVQYEIGLQQQLADHLGIDVTLFYRDIRNWVGTSTFISTPIPGVEYVVYENKDYSNVRGITLKMERRYAGNFSAALDYSLQFAEGSYSNPQDAFFAALAKEEPQLALIPLNWDQRHTLSARFTYDLNKWMISAIATYESGLPYTPTIAQGQEVGSSAAVGWRENSGRRPNNKNVDVLVSRDFRISGLTYTVFANIYNVFDIRDELVVWSDTGTAGYTTTIDPKRISYSEDRVSTVEDYIRRPSWLTPPREIQIGLRVSF